MFLFLLAGLIFTVVTIWILLFRTESLANWLKLSEEHLPTWPSEEILLLVGMRLLGLYLTILAARSIVVESFRIYVGHFTGEMTRSDQLSSFKNMIGPLFQLACGIFVMFQAQRVCGLITNNRDSEDEPEGEAGEEGSGMSEK